MNFSDFQNFQSRWGELKKEIQNLALPELERSLQEPVTFLEQKINRFSEPLVLALFGGTGVGKSTLINLLTGTDASLISSFRPTTSVGNVYYFKGEHKALPLLPFPNKLIPHQFKDHKNFILIDSPDFDSINRENGEIARDIFSFCDLPLLVLTLQKYNTKPVLEFCEKFPLENITILFSHSDECEDLKSIEMIEKEIPKYFKGVQTHQILFADFTETGDEFITLSGEKFPNGTGRLREILKEKWSGKNQGSNLEGKWVGIQTALKGVFQKLQPILKEFQTQEKEKINEIIPWMDDFNQRLKKMKGEWEESLVQLGLSLAFPRLLREVSPPFWGYLPFFQTTAGPLFVEEFRKEFHKMGVQHQVEVKRLWTHINKFNRDELKNPPPTISQLNNEFPIPIEPWKKKNLIGFKFPSYLGLFLSLWVLIGFFQLAFFNSFMDILAFLYILPPFIGIFLIREGQKWYLQKWLSQAYLIGLKTYWEGEEQSLLGPQNQINEMVIISQKRSQKIDQILNTTFQMETDFLR